MIFDGKSEIRLATVQGLINFAEFGEGIDHLLES